MLTTKDVVKHIGENGVFKAVMVPGTHFGFIWHGGAYIDTIRESLTGNFVIDGKVYNYGDECINVWDYSKNETEFPFDDNEALVSAINEWMQN